MVSPYYLHLNVFSLLIDSVNCKQEAIRHKFEKKNLG